MHSIVTLDNSKWVKDYDKYFHISSNRSDSPKISNTEMTDEIFDKIFNTVNSIIVVFPSDGGLYKDVSSKIREEDDGAKDEIKSLLRLDDVKFHSSELHNPSTKAYCADHVHYFKFSDYSEIVKFLDYLNTDKVVDLKVYTTLINENEYKVEPMSIKIDNSVHNTDNSTHTTTNNDNSTHSEVNTRGVFNKPKVSVKEKKEKSLWNKIVTSIFKLFGGGGS